MNKLLLGLLFFVTTSFINWQTDFTIAMQTAKQKHELILLNFSGSDWCGPCIRMRDEIFESKIFQTMADNSLVMFNADFPRNKKNQLSESLKKQNEMLADKYNRDGAFPYTVLLDTNGKVIKSWNGLPKENAEQFAKEIKAICDASK